MKRQRFWVMAGLVAAITLASLTSLQAETPKAHPTAVAVVDVSKVLNSIREREEMQSDLNMRFETFDTERKKREEELNRMDDTLKVINTNSPDYQKEVDKRERALFEFRGWMEWQRSQLERERRLNYIKLYRAMLDAIGRVAKDDGFDMVLFKEPAADFHNVKDEELATAMQARKVLYAQDNLDLTVQVIQLMDNEFNNRVGSTTRPKPAAPPAPAH